jgi:drug/metabolite transporter (DMT)-like permease
MKRLVRSGLFWLALSEFSFAVMRVATRAGAGNLPWAEIGAARFFGGAIVAVLSARLNRKSLVVGDRKNAWLRSAFGTGGALTLFYALGSNKIAVGDATTLYATSPLWVAVLSGPFLGERVGRATWAGVVLGFAGVGVLMGAHLSWTGPIGALVLLGGLSYALALLRLRRLGPHESSEAIALHMSLFAGTTLLLVALPNLRPVHASAYLPLIAAAVSGGLGQVFVGRAYARSQASRLAAFGYMGIVFTYGLEVVLFARAPAWNQIAGSLMVIAAGVGVSLAPRPATAGAAKTPAPEAGAVPAPLSERGDAS